MVPIVTGTIGLLVACVIILLMRKDRLHVNYGIGWVIVATAFALLGFAPSIIDQIAIYFGVSYPPVFGANPRSRSIGYQNITDGYRAFTCRITQSATDSADSNTRGRP